MYNFWFGLIILMAAAAVGYELGRVVTVNQVKSMLSEMSKALTQVAEKLKKGDGSYESGKSSENG